MAIASGTRLGRYEISSPLGAGGMGEVYLAQDTHLRRPAALKILPARFTESEDRLRRFEREASAASALNHPNIITIHEIGQEDGLHFMAMEFVDGETLRARLGHTRISLKDALDIAVQVADALSAAHEAGIVHRDIKPENIMIRRDGYVKVLDFGLAKLTERQTAVDSQAPTIAKADTDPGTVMGTMQYMSPEQARGKDVDKRTDIWSLGVVLYEMVAGHAPFEGESTSDVIVSLLSQEPPPLSQQVEEVPHELERITRKALQKNRDERYQTVKDMALDLKSLRRELEVGLEIERSLPPGLSGGNRIARSSAYRAATTTLKDSRASTGGWGDASSTSAGSSFVGSILHNRRRLALGLAIIALSSGLVFGLYKFFGQSKSKESVGFFKQAQVTRLTTNGNTRIAAISPDGKYIAYAMDESGKQSLWLRQVAISSNVRLLPLAEVEFYACGFSADGDFVYYAMAEKNNPPAIYKIPVLGGSPTKVLGDLTGPVSLSPDGKQIAVVDINREQQEAILSIANVDGTGKRKLMSRKAPEFLDWMAWSPDGKSLACPISSFTERNPLVKIVEVQVADGAEKVITSQRWLNSSQIEWLADKSGLVVIAQHQDSSFSQIWHVSYPEGAVQLITNDLTDYRGVSLSKDSKALVSVQIQKLSNLWLSKSAKDYSTTQITPGAGTYYDLAWTTDGHVLYASDASGSSDIWEMELDGTNQKQLTAGAERNYSPVATPDGRYIAFHSNRSGTWQIWRMNRDGSNPKQLTSDNTDSNWPQVSPDSQWIVYHHVDASGTMILWKVGIDGGAPVQLTTKLAVRPTISPDGKWIAYWYFSNQTSQSIQIAVMPFTGGEPVKFFDLTPNAMAGWDSVLKWTPDGRALTYTERRNNTDNVWAQPFSGGKPTQLTDFKDYQIFSFDWLRDGRLICSRGFRAGDAVLIKDSR
ncbi:MAG: eukaryotic-like serine/threonine-protein kinase [Acidobacteriota bacterium]|jgi:serine/threonine protein kinase/Tol biopolymer transport system component|nr:eukaryotic-like serine/threonine-protein kinase [Acidobacteriota bacterium]